VLIETNGVYSGSKDILRLIKSAGAGNLFVIWDIHHTYRYGGKNPKIRQII
jgi:fatty-acyl-CoA synthase